MKMSNIAMRYVRTTTLFGSNFALPMKLTTILTSAKTRTVFIAIAKRRGTTGAH